MRVNGRCIRASNMAERRLLLALGSTALRVPRSVNPYVVARRLSRAASSDVLLAREIVSQLTRPKPAKAPVETVEPAAPADVASR